jgi:hypothetical protein
MNKRIQEMIKQATAIEYGVDNGFDRVTFDKEKFAQLIVRECADIGERYADGNYEVRNQIMAQFGLEEPEE